jgi:vacuolar protein sorting-associated protein 35
LEPAVNVKQIVISLIDRLAAYALREADELDASIADTSVSSPVIPQEIHLFDVFWTEIKNLITARPDLTIEDISALLVSIENLSLSCYPHAVENIDLILNFAIEKIHEYKDRYTSFDTFLNVINTSFKVQIYHPRLQRKTF